MKTYEEVLRLILDSEDVKVGGGSASALSGAMACGLIGMTCRLSVKKDFGIAPEKQLEYAKELDDIRDKLLEGVVKDANAFGVIREAMKLPKDKEEEKEIRKKAISDAGVVGATAPKENANLARRVYDISLELDGKTNPNLDSDIKIGRELAKMATMGCLDNVKANLPLIKDEKALDKFKQEIEKLRID